MLNNLEEKCDMSIFPSRDVWAGLQTLRWGFTFISYPVDGSGSHFVVENKDIINHKDTWRERKGSPLTETVKLLDVLRNELIGNKDHS